MAALTTPTPEHRRSTRSRLIDFTWNAAALALLWFGYSAVRGVTADEFSVAMDNARDLLRLQHLIGLPSELGFQQVLIRRTHLIQAANSYYIGVHFPVTVAFLAWVWLRHRSKFGRIRNTLIAVTGTGLLIHLAYPLAPPRMVAGFVDTAAVFGPNPYDLSVSQAANQIAAMPSLHVGWALLVSLGVISILRSPLRWLAIAHPAITLAVVVLTANHYWLDAAVAIALVTVSWIGFSYKRHPAQQSSSREPTAAPSLTAPPTVPVSPPAVLTIPPLSTTLRVHEGVGLRV